MMGLTASAVHGMGHGHVRLVARDCEYARIAARIVREALDREWPVGRRGIRGCVPFVEMGTQPVVCAPDLAAGR